MSVSRVVTEQAQFVDVDGNVYIGGQLVGRTTPTTGCTCSKCRLGWAVWGLEAAGPPLLPADRLDGSSGRTDGRCCDDDG
ncbi:MAG: hypothetical protein WKF73_05705 [Nocardioidaceae bacterium]